MARPPTKHRPQKQPKDRPPPKPMGPPGGPGGLGPSSGGISDGPPPALLAALGQTGGGPMGEGGPMPTPMGGPPPMRPRPGKRRGAP